MPASRKPEKPSPYVTIVSNTPETLDALQTYLGRAGVSSHGTRSADDFAKVAPVTATATVIFPDDFDEAIVLRLVAELRRKRPRLLTLLVTRTPNRFRSVVSGDERSLTPIVLPKPSFGWDILDAIRDHSLKPQV